MDHIDRSTAPGTLSRAPHWHTGIPLSAQQRIAAWVFNAWRTAIGGVPERNYKRRVLRRLRQGDLHATLGNTVRDVDYARRKANRWLDELVALGLRPHHLCVEFGCGSLWCAEPVIRYLESGRFIGLDVTDEFYAMGRERLDELVTEKEVRLAVIGRRRLHAVAAMQPDFIFSRKVLPHVPTRALARYLRNITGLMNEHTIAVIDNKPLGGPDSYYRGSRHTIEQIVRHLPPDIRCCQQPFGLVLVHRDGP